MAWSSTTDTWQILPNKNLQFLSREPLFRSWSRPRIGREDISQSGCGVPRRADRRDRPDKGAHRGATRSTLSVVYRRFAFLRFFIRFSLSCFPRLTQYSRWRCVSEHSSLQNLCPPRSTSKNSRQWVLAQDCVSRGLRNSLLRIEYNRGRIPWRRLPCASNAFLERPSNEIHSITHKPQSCR